MRYVRDRKLEPRENTPFATRCEILLKRAVAVASLAMLCVVVPTHAGQSVKLFADSPDPRDLAEILFPPRHRSIVVKDDPVKPASPKMFGLLINFAFDSTVILPESLPLLDSIGEMMNLDRVAGRPIIVEGHTDAIGRDGYNQSLSERRARAIKRYLVSVFNIEPSRLVVMGKGEAEPHNANDPTNAINRRVVFKPRS